MKRLLQRGFGNHPILGLILTALNLVGWGWIGHLAYQQQNFPGGSGITSVTSLPALPCTANAQVNLTTGAQGVYTCQNGVWVGPQPTFHLQSYTPLNRKVLYNCTWASSSAVITCPSGTFTSTAVDGGKIAYATSLNGAGGLGAISAGAATKLCAQTTILSVQSSTQATLAANCTSGNGTNTPFIFGSDESSGVAAALTAAANACGTLIWDAGSAIVQSNPFPNPPTTNCANNVSTSRADVAIIGQEPSMSQLTFAPNFDWTTCNKGTLSNACIGANGGVAAGGYFLRGFAVNNYGIDYTIAAAHVVFEFEANTYGEHVYCLATAPTNANLTAMRFGITPHNGFDLQEDACGATGWNVSNSGAAGITISNSYAGDNFTNPVLVNSGTLNSVQNIYGPSGNSSTYDVRVEGTGANFISQNDTFIGSSATGGVLVGNQTVVVNVYLTNDLLPNGSGSGSTLFCGVSGSKFVLFGNQISATGAGGKALNSVAGCNLIDLGGNTITTTAANTISGGAFNFTLSAAQTACATGNFALTSGWGTSSVTSVAANGTILGCHVTITGAAGAAGPVLTWTYPAAPVVAPASCHLIGTTASLTGVQVGTPGATSVAFTFVGTPAAVTYQFDVGCP